MSDDMNRVHIKEADIAQTVHDFEVFCRFLDERKPVLSKKGYMGQKDLFECNNKLHYRREVDAPNYQQSSYPTIMCMFQLALLGMLYQRKTDEGGHAVLLATQKKDEFDRLSQYDKYAFLFATFMVLCDWKDIGTWYGYTTPIELLLGTFAKLKLPTDLNDVDDQFNVLLTLYLSDVPFLRVFEYFGFCKIAPNQAPEKDATKRQVELRMSGTRLSNAFCKNRFVQKLIISDVNIPLRGRYFLEKEAEEKLIDANYELMYKILRSLFVEGALQKTLLPDKPSIVKGKYIFHVSIKRGVWRKIALSHNHTLDDLHLAIVDSCSISDYELYAFFMDGTKRSKEVYHSPLTEDYPLADEVSIGELHLYVKQQILYLYNWRHEGTLRVKLAKIDQEAKWPKEPVVIESRGDDSLVFSEDD